MNATSITPRVKAKASPASSFGSDHSSDDDSFGSIKSKDKDSPKPLIEFNIKLDKLTFAAKAAGIEDEVQADDIVNHCGSAKLKGENQQEQRPKSSKNAGRG